MRIVRQFVQYAREKTYVASIAAQQHSSNSDLQVAGSGAHPHHMRTPCHTLAPWGTPLSAGHLLALETHLAAGLCLVPVEHAHLEVLMA